MEDVGPAFEIGGRAFTSFGDCRSWLASKAPGSIDYLGLWVDPFSMSSFAEAQTRDANAKLVHKSMLAKANFSGGSNEASIHPRVENGVVIRGANWQSICISESLGNTRKSRLCAVPTWKR